MTQHDQFGHEVLESLSTIVGTRLDAGHLEHTLASVGLDSLGSLRWRQLLLTRCGVEVSLAALDGTTTVSAALEHIRTAASEDLPMSTGDVPEEPVELTLAQQAYWAGRGGDFAGGGVATFWYHEYERLARHRDGRDVAEDLDRLETAWKRVVARHPMLRTVIDRDARPHIARHDVRDWRLTRVDLTHLDSDEAERTAQQFRRDLSHQVRPADRWPLIDIVAILLPHDRVRMCVGFDALVVDFTSWGLIMREWGSLMRRPRTQFEPPAITVAELLETRSSDPRRRHQRARDRAWWREQFLPPAPLPQAKPPVSSARFKRHQRRIPASAWAEISNASRQDRISPTATVLTAFAVACARWGASPEGMSLNLTVFDRPEEAEDVVGDFSSTALVPLTPERGFAPDEPNSFAELAAAVQSSLFDALEHSSYAGIEVARDRSHERWPVVFTSGLGQSSGVEDRWLGERVFGVSQTPQVVWDHLVWEEDGDLVLVHDVVESAVDEPTVDGVVDMELALLHSLLQARGWYRPAPGWDPRAELPPPARRRTDAGPLLHDPWESAHRKDPALWWPGGSWDHGRLREQAERMAAALRDAGATVGDLILVVLPKSPDQVAAVLGVLLAGAGYVPADPSWPLARLESIREQTGLRLAVADETTVLPGGVTRVSRTASPVPCEPARAEPDDLAYVIFTSGSTGTPKGVAIEHRQARSTIDEITARFDVRAGDRILALSALSFDLSVYDIFGVLGAGGSIVLPDPGRLRDPHHWLELMARHKVTLWNSAPPLMEMLLEYAESVPDLAREALSGLKHCLLSGDWIPVTLPDRLRSLAPQAHVHSLGGATEASIWSITYPIDEVDPRWPSIPYGRPLPGQSFWILDDKGTPVTVGVAGELYIGGDGVARGYIGADHLTAERFIDRPDLGTRLYRTGDLGRWLADGSIEFLGRVDRQVKVGGNRIELGEIEAALLRLPAVRQAVASAVPGPDGRPRLIAHVSPHAHGWNMAGPEDELRIRDGLSEALRESLPSYMVPTRFVLLDEIPTTDNGKLDYRALGNPYDRGASPAPAASDEISSASPECRGPSSLRAAIMAIAGAEADPTASLVRNGVTSLQLVRIANAVEDFGFPRPDLASLMGHESLDNLIDRWQAPERDPNLGDEPESPVVAAEVPGVDDAPGSLAMLATRLRRATDLLDDARGEIDNVVRALGLPATSVAPPSVPDDEFDLTEMQLAYLMGRAADRFGRCLAPHYYTEAVVDGLDPHRLSRAWEVILRRHPMLRASITETTRQRVGEEVTVPLEVLDHQGLTTSEQERARVSIRQERSHRLLPVDRAPLLRMLAVRLDEQRWRLHFDLDLLLCDARSAVIITSELATVYHDPAAKLPAVEGVFADWARKQDILPAARQYWEGAIAGLPDPVTPPLRHDAATEARFVRRRCELDAQSWARIRRAAANGGVTVSCLLLHTLGMVLSPERPGTVMLTLSRRPREQEAVVGDFTATMPVAVGGTTGLHQGHAALADALEHSLPPGGMHGNSIIRMLRAAGRPADISVAVSCALDPDSGRTLTAASLDASQLLDVFGETCYAISQTPHVLLDIQLFDVEGRLCCNLDADEALVPSSWLDELHAAWVSRLHGLAREVPGDVDVASDVMDVFAEVLSGVRLDLGRTWFDQGATSLTLVSAQRLLRERGYEASVVDLLAHPTPAQTIDFLVGMGTGPKDAGALTASRLGSPARIDAAQRRGRRRRAAREQMS